MHKLTEILVTGGYYQLGKVFLAQEKIMEASAVFDKVVAIWKAAVKTNEQLGNTEFFIDQTRHNKLKLFRYYLI